MWSLAKPSGRAFVLVLALALAASGPAVAQTGKPAKDDPSEPFFRYGAIPRLVVELDDAAVESLRNEPRKWVLGRLKENDKTVYKDVAVKLKGAAGSFREFDDQPSLSIRVDAEEEDQIFHGLKKFHLNRSPQDATRMHELLGGEIYRAAGILTPRVTHARVWINKRDMGVYVLLEGFDRTLLRRGFEKTRGNLYDGGFCQDIDGELEKDSGKGPDDRSDLKALLAACREPDLVKRWARLPELVDIKNFITHMAVELMLGHWDGYCGNRNNYRLYFDPSTRKAFFLPHGMDQIFQDADASILDHPGAILADAIMKNPAWRADYRKRVGELLPLFNAEKLKKKIDEVQKRLAPAFQAWDKDRAREQEAAVEGLKAALDAREKSLKEQRSLPEPKPLVFTANTPVRVGRWRTNSECEDAILEAEKDNGVDVLGIKCGKSGRCVASWRRSVLLSTGKYRFQALIRVKGVVVLKDDAPKAGAGAGLRIPGGGTRENQLLGTGDFKRVDLEFEVTEEQRDVELIIELRSSKGEMAVRTDSIVLMKVEK